MLSQALKSHDHSTKPLYVSVGHKVSLEAAVRLTRGCCKFRIPEPVRQVGGRHTPSSSFAPAPVGEPGWAKLGPGRTEEAELLGAPARARGSTVLLRSASQPTAAGTRSLGKPADSMGGTASCQPPASPSGPALPSWRQGEQLPFAGQPLQGRWAVLRRTCAGTISVSFRSLWGVAHSHPATK